MAHFKDVVNISKINGLVICKKNHFCLNEWKFPRENIRMGCLALELEGTILSVISGLSGFNFTSVRFGYCGNIIISSLKGKRTPTLLIVDGVSTGVCETETQKDIHTRLIYIRREIQINGSTLL